MNSGRKTWLRFALPLLTLTLLIVLVGTFGYRYLSQQVRDETHRTLAVIAEQKRQQIEDSLAERRLDAELYFSGHSQLELLFEQWLRSGRRDAVLREQIKGRMAELARVRAWEGLAVLDPRGGMILSVGDVRHGQLSERARDIARQPRIELVDLQRQPGEHFADIARLALDRVAEDVRHDAGLACHSRRCFQRLRQHGMAGFIKTLRPEAALDRVRLLDVYLGALNTKMLSHRSDLAECIDPREAAQAIVRSYRKRMQRYAGMGFLQVWYERIDERAVLEALSPKLRRSTERILDKARSKMLELWSQDVGELEPTPAGVKQASALR